MHIKGCTKIKECRRGYVVLVHVAKINEMSSKKEGENPNMISWYYFIVILTVNGLVYILDKYKQTNHNPNIYATKTH